MRKLAIAAAVSISLTSVSGVTRALGLGEIEMYSALNQSLDAEIAILSATDDELRDMRVGLATADAYARAGLEQLPILSSVTFDVDRRPDGKPVIKVSSDGPVFEPFLNFLIEVDAPGSVKLLREYTVLLNPSNFASTNNDATPAALSTPSQGEGVQIDLSDVAVVSGSMATVSDLAATESIEDLAGEVVFSESRVTPVAAAEPEMVAKPLDEDNLFIPDNQVVANSDSPSTLRDSNGQAISLTQELSTTPQFDEPTVNNSATGELIDLSDSDAAGSMQAESDDGAAMAGGGELLSLDNLGAQAEEGAAIFGNEFDTGKSELIASDELREIMDAEAKEVLATDSMATIDIAEVEFEETIISALDDTDDLFTADSTDADSGNDTIDISGVIDDSTAIESSGNSSTDGIIVEIDDSATSLVAEVTGATYRVKKADTLWSIANREKARGVSPHQMMVALVSANPEAFVGGNMNRMRNGSVLQIPTEGTQNSVDRGNALAIVKDWTDGNTISTTRVVNRTAEPVVVKEMPTIANNDTSTSANAELARDLEEVNRRMEQARDELAAENLQRDEIQGRVNSLEDNMEKMKGLITLRESELNKLQEEVSAAESTPDAGSGKFVGNDAAAIEKQADADKNLASAEAEAQSVRLSSEEDSLRAQLAALQVEKRDLEASSQLEKAELVRQAELEKTRLLEQARAERERVMAELDVEKARISKEAELEIARIKGQSDTESQRLLSESQAERDRLVSETTQMQTQLEEMEAERARLIETAESDAAKMQQEAAAEQARILAEAEAEKAKLQAEAEEQARTTAAAAAEEKARLQAEAAEQARLTAEAQSESARVKDRLAKLQQQAEQAQVDSQVAMPAVDTDAEGTVNQVTDAGKKMAAGGAAAVGGLLGAAPQLQESIGNRKNVLGAGAALSLLGLLAAWGMRRRRNKEPEEVRALRPRADNRVADPEYASNFDNNNDMYGQDQANTQNRSDTGRSGAAAAAAAAAAVTGTAVHRDANAQVGNAQVADAPEAKASEQSATSPSDAELEETALDDTITEAEVYLRYGLHGQAEDLLKTAIDRSPDNEEYHFKLLENYHDQKNPDDFDVAAKDFTEKFPNSGHHSRVEEMRGELKTAASHAGTAAAGAAAAAGGAATALASTRNAVSDSAEEGADAVDKMFDETIDPGTEFSVDELQATGDLGSMVDSADIADDEGGLLLDDVDLASLDDDGTMNLEEVAGNQMSGGDLGTLDLTNTDGDNTFDNLSLDDADLNMNDATGDIRSGLEADFPVGGTAAGSDEMETMLDLAKAYMDMGDDSSAQKALTDIAARGNPLQQAEATELLKKLT